MSNSIQLKSISELLGNNFFIPSYQRGYRWTEQQVEDLLEDIYAFAIKKGKEEKEFYCLQPIVVKKHKWQRTTDENSLTEVEGWELVDGQQRLTTIKILLNYLIKKHLVGKPFKEYYGKGKDVFSIEYETREDSKRFLDNIESNDDTIDFYHISEAYSAIEKWFKKKVTDEDLMLSEIYDLMLNPLAYSKNNKSNINVVQVIWYELNDDANPIDSFIRINLGKIPLTNSELIKALFLQERCFGIDTANNQNDVSKLRQLEIASEWDRIENTLQNDDFWWFLNKNRNTAPSRIEFIFDRIVEVAKNDNPNLKEKIGTDRNATFRYFYQKFDGKVDFNTLKEQWKIVKNYFLTFEEWYNNPTWYHYIGFLIYCGEDILNIIGHTRKDFSTQKEIKTKDDATLSLKKAIKKRYENVGWNIEVNQPFLNLSYGNDSHKQKINELLLLFNLEYIIAQNQRLTLIYKFPFKSFKEIRNENNEEIKWNIEHIDSFTEKQINDKKEQIEWITDALQDIGKDLPEDLEKRCQDFKDDKGLKGDFFELQKAIIEKAGEGEQDETVKHNIGNLTLLDSGTNQGYGNALFPTKRRKIIEKDKSGVFIPICTKNVFLKYFDLKGETGKAKWGLKDIKNYRDEIANTLIDFLPTKPKTKK